MLLLPLRANRLSARGIRTCSARLCLYHEVTDIFTTAGPMRSHRPSMDRLGNGRYQRREAYPLCRGGEVSDIFTTSVG
jgi:hypothetical protein